MVKGVVAPIPKVKGSNLMSGVVVWLTMVC